MSCLTPFGLRVVFLLRESFVPDRSLVFIGSMVIFVTFP